jgi:hypothetical protein
MTEFSNQSMLILQEQEICVLQPSVAERLREPEFSLQINRVARVQRRVTQKVRSHPSECVDLSGLIHIHLQNLKKVNIYELPG